MKKISLTSFETWRYFLLIFIFVFSFYYFFTERLPWFFYDDIERVETAGKTDLLHLVNKIFSPPTYNTYERPVLGFYVKFCSFFFDEDPHYYRMIKIVVFASTLSSIFYLLISYGGNSFIVLSSLFVLATYPAVTIVNAWVNESATLELFFKIASIVVFLKMISEDKLTLKNIMLAGMILLLVLFADKSKGTAKIIPFIFLGFLLITKNKRPFFYIISFASLLLVVPINVISPNRNVALSGFFSIQNGIHLFYTFLSHIWPLLVFSVLQLLFLIIRKYELFKNNLFIILTIWLIYELCFYFFYPSNEMRYLFSSLVAAISLFSIIISHSMNLMNKKNAMIATMIFIALTSYSAISNFWWAYNFRGSWGAYFILADKKMNFINQNFKNSLALYNMWAPLYYSRNTSNQFVNLSPKNSWNISYDEIYSNTPQGIEIINPTQYETVILLDETVIHNTVIAPTGTSTPIKVFDSIIEDSLYDSFQKTVNFRLRNANLYDRSLTTTVYYPTFGGIYYFNFLKLD